MAIRVKQKVDPAEDVGIFLAPVLREMPEDEETSLLRRLEVQGKVKTHSNEAVLIAKRMYIAESQSIAQIAQKLKVPQKAVRRWITLFGWEEERDRRLFQKFRQINDLRRSSKDLEQRADRIFGTIESVAEELLEGHHNGETLSPKDLATLAGCVKTTLETRMGLRGERKSKKVEHTVDVKGNVGVEHQHEHSGSVAVDGAILHQLGMAIRDATGNNEKIKLIENQNRISISQSEDVEYERIENVDSA